jgi:hypothetical protein
LAQIEGVSGRDRLGDILKGLFGKAPRRRLSKATTELPWPTDSHRATSTKWIKNEIAFVRWRWIVPLRLAAVVDAEQNWIDDKRSFLTLEFIGSNSPTRKPLLNLKHLRVVRRNDQDVV